MRTKNYHLKRRGGRYWYKRRVPKDLIPLIGKEHVEIALKTTDEGTARLFRDRLDRKLEQQWNKLRWEGKKAQPPSPPDVGNLGPDDVEHLWDQIDNLAMKYAEGDEWEDLVEARERVFATPTGAAIGQQIRRAQGLVSVEEAGEKFLAIANMRDTTKSGYKYLYRTASQSLASPAQVTKNEAREFLQGYARDHTKSSSSNMRLALKALWDHLGLDSSIWLGFRIDPGKAKQSRDKWEDEEFKLLMEHANPSQKLVIQIAAYTGARSDEIKNLSYDEAKDLITIGKSKTPAGIRTIPCPDKIRGAVREWAAVPVEKRVTPKTAFTKLKMKLKEGGVEIPPSKVLHSFRHTVMTKLHEAKVQEATVALIVGHKHDKMTFGIYGGKVDPETLRDVVNLVSYGE